MNNRYSEVNLVLRRDNYRIRLYSDQGKWFRVYNGNRLVHQGNEYRVAYIVYNKEL